MTYEPGSLKDRICTLLAAGELRYSSLQEKLAAGSELLDAALGALARDGQIERRGLVYVLATAAAPLASTTVIPRRKREFAR